MINPITLLGVSWVMGWQYLGISFLAILIAGAAYFVYSISLNLFLLSTPILLYSLIIHFRLLGLSYKHCLPDTTPSAEQSSHLEVDKQSRLALINQLGKLYEEKKSASLKNVNDRLLTIAQFDNWSRFDPIYEVLSSWDDKRPALKLVKEYLPQLLKHKNPVKAFNLCHWALLWESEFSVDDPDVMKWLVQNAATNKDKYSLVAMIDAYLSLPHSEEEMAQVSALGEELDAR
jgi:hypothetical protein